MPESRPQTRFIFVTGGVVSALGKGIASASIGQLLVSRGLSVTLQKFDPYINVDPGTMSPFQHGEVFVTEDGAETDLDLGHYERFTDVNATRASNATAGAIYNSVIRRERRGDYLGGTVQVIPHITDEIKNRIRLVAESADVDIVITEVGGTVGDIESLPFLEALRQFQVDQGRDRCMFIHLTLVPFLGHAGELKTKPTQHSVQELRRIGIQPDMVVCRSEESLGRDIREKIALFANLPVESVVSARDVDSIYKVPLHFHAEGVDDRILGHFGMEASEPDLPDWRGLVERIESASTPVRIGLVGKYTQLADAYLSVIEALNHAGAHHGGKIELRWVESERLSDREAEEELAACDGILIPGGFGVRGIEGKIAAARYAREHGVPYLGICLGMQIAVADFARHVAGMEGANSTEFDPETPYPVIDLLPEQKEVRDMGGTMRLGADPVKLHEGTRTREIYDGEAVIYERHRHRYEVNNHLRKRLEHAGLVCSGTSPDDRLVEVIELPDHRFFVASQFHPEFKSRPLRPQPLFREFVRAAYERALERAPEVEPDVRAGERVEAAD
jgi:CTP synthase